VLREPLRRRDVFVGSSLVALAVFFRLQNGLYALALVGLLFGRRKPRAAVEALAALALFALAFGLLDRLSWGAWFQSARVYLSYQAQARASMQGTPPAGYYLTTTFRAMPLVTLGLFAAGVLAARRARGLLAVILAALLVHTLVPHKELRYVLPALVLACALAGVGLSEAAARWPRGGALFGLALLGAALASAARAQALRFVDVGRPLETSAWDFPGEVNRLLLRLHDREDVCGVWIASTVGLEWTGGHVYLHRPVPIYVGNRVKPGAFNYVLSSRPRGEVVDRERRRDGESEVLVSRVGSTCVADPDYDWRL
jgi:hypothetical protein